jgi:hypothetical protein
MADTLPTETIHFVIGSGDTLCFNMDSTTTVTCVTQVVVKL